MCEDVCVICLLSYDEKKKDEDKCVFVKCKHSFHACCIQTWMLQSKSCPICRTEVDTCCHGTLWDHDQNVIKTVIESELTRNKTTIQEQETRINVLTDRIYALDMDRRMMMEEYIPPAIFTLMLRGAHVR